MVVFNKDITLYEKMREYDKESLKSYGFDLGLTRLSQLKKDDLARRIVDELLNPEVMYYRGAILSDKEITVFERGFNGPITYSDDESDAIGTLNEMDFIIVSKNKYVVPCDVVKVWQDVKNEKFMAYHKKASWIWKCLYWAEEMYAFTPIDIMLELVNVKKGMKIDEVELKEIFNHFPEDRLWSIFVHDVFLSSIYYGNMDALDDLRYAQADKEFYFPSAAEVEEYHETGALLSGKEYQDMLAFMIKKLGMDKEEARYTLLDLWDKIAMDDDPHGTMQWFWNQFEFENDKQVEQIVALYMPIANGTRMMVNRGHKPSEIYAMRPIGPGNMPVITAGSSQAAEMLRQAAPEIQRMGFGLDLDSNADRIPVMGFPNGLNGKAVISEKKIYPNDPCPCGSGMKYKKCCGKGQANKR